MVWAVTGKIRFCGLFLNFVFTVKADPKKQNTVYNKCHWFVLCFKMQFSAVQFVKILISQNIIQTFLQFFGKLASILIVSGRKPVFSRLELLLWPHFRPDRSDHFHSNPTAKPIPKTSMVVFLLLSHFNWLYKSCKYYISLVIIFQWSTAAGI